MSRPNILLITVDCMRRDRLSAYGYERLTTPFLDALLPRALHCTSAHSTSSWTCPSVISLLTGRYPHRHGGGLVPGDPKNLAKESLPTLLGRETPMLPDLLREEGYASGAIGGVWNAHLSIPGRFDTMVMLERPADRLVQRALAWIAEQRGPWFLWLHLGDAHEPLRFPRSMRHSFGHVPRLPKVRRWAYTKADDPVHTEAFERYRAARVRVYDVAIRSVDRSIQRLLDAGGLSGRFENAIVTVTSDHGEEFWEHRAEEMEGFTDPRNVYGTGHGHNLYQVHVLVPLVVLGPGIVPGAVQRNVSLVDWLPTIAEAGGLGAVDTDGRSLLSDVDPERPIISEAVAYGHDKASVVMGDLKLLRSPGDGFERVFRLGSDRRELETVDAPESAARLSGPLGGRSTSTAPQVVATGEIERHLRDLGYIE